MWPCETPTTHIALSASVTIVLGLFHAAKLLRYQGYSIPVKSWGPRTVSGGQLCLYLGLPDVWANVHCFLGHVSGTTSSPVSVCTLSPYFPLKLKSIQVKNLVSGGSQKKKKESFRLDFPKYNGTAFPYSLFILGGSTSSPVQGHLRL